MALRFSRQIEPAELHVSAGLHEGFSGIALAGPDDLPEMNRIEQEAFSTPWSLELMRGALANHRYRVRVLRSGEEELIAFYIAHTSDTASNLDNLAVTESRRRQGFGRRLVVDWIAHACRQRLSTVTLQVNTRNHAAERLYRALSFRRARLLSGYYPNGEDAYQMERDLLP